MLIDIALTLLVFVITLCVGCSVAIGLIITWQIWKETRDDPDRK